MLPPIPVNLYVDHLSSSGPVVSISDLYQQTTVEGPQYKKAGMLLGLTEKQYNEFLYAVLAGNAEYVRLPRRLDAMTGRSVRRGVYVIHNVSLPSNVWGYRINLSEGAQVFVPNICGNLAILRPATRAITAEKFHNVVYTYPKVQPILTVPPTPIVFTPPVASVPTSGVSVSTPAVIGTPSTNYVPFVVGAFAGAIYGITHENNSPVAPCSAGSNIAGVCRP